MQPHSTYDTLETYKKISKALEISIDDLIR